MNGGTNKIGPRPLDDEDDALLLVEEAPASVAAAPAADDAEDDAPQALRTPWLAATLALGLMFLQTNNGSVAAQLRLPSSLYSLSRRWQQSAARRYQMAAEPRVCSGDVLGRV